MQTKTEKNSGKYKIIRFFKNGKKKTMLTGVSLAFAQQHCSSDDSKGTTGRGVEWFDGYDEIKHA